MWILIIWMTNIRSSAKCAKASIFWINLTSASRTKMVDHTKISGLWDRKSSTKLSGWQEIQWDIVKNIIRICHTVVLDDPFEDLRGLDIPPRSPEPTDDRLEVCVYTSACPLNGPLTCLIDKWKERSHKSRRRYWHTRRQDRRRSAKNTWRTGNPKTG